jgi:ADP-heptose:LPS heptosyltransferase
VRRLVALRLDNAGDVVMLGPALRAIRQALPEVHLSLLASPAGVGAARLLPWVDSVLPWRASWQDASAALPLDPSREQALISELQRRAFDAALVFTSFSQSVWPPAYACYLAGIPRRVGQAKDFGGSLLTDRIVPLPDCVHQAERNLHLVEALGIPVARRDLEIRVPAAADARAAALLHAAGLHEGAPFILVAPGASCAARRYDAMRYAQALALLARRVGLPMVLVGHAREAALLNAICAAARSPLVTILARDTSFEELAALVRRARLLLGNNSGPMHLADAVRCPMVILYSGSDLEEQWRPRDAPARLLRRPTPCDPCYRFECPFQMECLDIPARQVAVACEEMLSRTAHRAAARPAPVVGTRPRRARAGAGMAGSVEGAEP